MVSHRPLRRIPAPLYNKPSWLLAPDPSMLPVPTFNDVATVTVQRQSLITVPAPKPSSRSLPSSDSVIFPPLPKYADVMRMENDLPVAEARRRARAIDPIGYAAEAPQGELPPPPSFDDIRRMQPDLPWEEVMKRAGNIDQAALARDMISQQGPERLEALLRPLATFLSPQWMDSPTIDLPESSFNQSSMNAEEAMTSSLFLSSTKDKNGGELKAFATFLAVWLHATVTNESRTEVTK
ncbi:uncharacterized protein BT62DRAFT_930406 [Guyanagaster necrorhizus]|uniref:Uncharacterized protein n=1 Tax=Guyanagaster necrorhizus TaxID=856835 RepID=A0A9P7VVW8_9AGAR|nr:uncharacterized protein BT62DRAFT_930406 [Guyanagaster necrorhizus MCA 3950]KAG7448318.1 hypothetical protein BT62DRAFT_930406 [Guyanagaster necrorhizus MCA 3950]